MDRLKGKVAIITGGAQGMGASHVKLFVKEGAKVIISDINEDAGKELAKELGDNAAFIKHDVSKESDWERVVAETETTFGPVNVLVNNAAIAPYRPIGDFTTEEYKKVININQVGTFLGIKAVIPSMTNAQGGSIINISSTDGQRGNVYAIAYGSSKWAVTGITKIAAVELADRNIRVNSVHPGITDTPAIQSSEASKNVEGLIQSGRVPIKRVAEPEEISKMVLFLASDDSSYSTGSEFNVDGGMTAKL